MNTIQNEVAVEINHDFVPLPLHQAIDPDAANIAAGIPVPQPGSIWIHRSDVVYQVLAVANIRLPGKPGYPPTVVYCDGDGHVYAGALADWHGRMTLLANPLADARRTYINAMRREVELLTANNREVERRREAERQVTAMGNVLLAYQEWEAAIILDRDCWLRDGCTVDRHHYDRMMEIQAMRNAALGVKW